MIKIIKQFYLVVISGGPLSALIYSQSWVGSWVYTTQAMMTFTLIF